MRFNYVMMKKIQRTKGFTLIELILYMGLTVIFLGILTDLFVSTLDLKTEAEATSAVEQDGRFILSRLMYDANQNGATSLTTDYSLVDENLVLDGEKLNSSDTKVKTMTFETLGNVGGKQSVQVNFELESIVERPSGPESREYQITLGSR